MKNKKRLIAALIALTMATSGLSACGNSKSTYESADQYFSELQVDSKKNNKAGVVVNGDTALVFLDEYSSYFDQFYSRYFTYGDDYFYGNVNEIYYSDRQSLESKIKSLVGEDGEIIYQENYPKTKGDKDYACVIINGNNALVFTDDFYLNFSKYDGPSVKYKDDEFYSNINRVYYKDKDELERKVKVLVGDNGTITYEGSYGKNR